MKKLVDPIRYRVFNNTVTKATITGIIINTTDIVYPSNVIKFVSNYSGVGITYSLEKYYVTAAGISKRNKDDIYDRITGFRIAESRAMIKLYKFMYKLCKEFTKEINPLIFGTSDVTLDYIGKIDGLPEDMIKYQKFLDRENKHLNNLISKK